LTVILGRASRLRPVIPVSLATVQFSRSAKRQRPPHGSRGSSPPSRRRRRRSLKTQQHAAASTGMGPLLRVPSTAVRPARSGRHI